MGEVAASARSRFLSTLTLSNQMVSHSFKAFLSPIKNFRWAVPGFIVPSTSGGTGGNYLMENNNLWWWFFGLVPLLCMIKAFFYFRAQNDPTLFIFSVAFSVTFMTGLTIFHVLVVISVLYWHRDMPFQLMGAKAKFMIEVVPMITAAALHHLLAFNYGYLFLLLGCTTYFYTFAHFLHTAYDIGGLDVLFGVAIQVLAYALNIELLARALALGFCFGLCLYRYMTYCAPYVPPHGKKELEQCLPC